MSLEVRTPINEKSSATLEVETLHTLDDTRLLLSRSGSFSSLPSGSYRSHREERHHKKESRCNSTTSVVITLTAILLAASLALGLYSTITLTTPRYPSCTLNPVTCKDQSSVPDLFTIAKTVLVIVPHPGDAEAAAGGTIARLIASDITVHYLILTYGSRDFGPVNMTNPAELASIRQREQRQAAAAMKVASVDFLGLLDGDFDNTENIRSNVTYFIRVYRPDVVFTWDPRHDLSLYSWGLDHRDHRITGQIVLDSIYPNALSPLYYPEQLSEKISPWIVKQCFLFSWEWNSVKPHTNVAIDIGTTMAQKIDTMLIFKSRIVGSQAEESRLQQVAEALGSASQMKYSEWFTRIIYATST